MLNDKASTPSDLGKAEVKPHGKTGEVITSQADNKVAQKYGKTEVGQSFPSNKDLLDQIDADQKKHVNSFDRKPFGEERKIAEKLTPDDLKNVGAIVDAIQKDHNKLGEALKPFLNDPKKLDDLKDMVTLELERRKLPYSVDLQYLDSRPQGPPSGSMEDSNGRALVVNSLKNPKNIFGYETTGRKLTNDDFRAFYD